jgi:DNA polymerase-1
MIRIDNYLIEHGLEKEARILMQVHDEIVMEVKDSTVKKIQSDIKKMMEQIISPKDIKGITIVADAKVGDNWGEMEKL